MSIEITNYEIRDGEGEFAWIKNWDGSESIIPLEDAVQMIREINS